MATLSLNAVNVRRVALESDLETDLRRAKALATLLDAQFNILGFRFGLDPIVDAIPVVGDSVMFLAGLYPVYVARKHKLGRGIEWRMIGNLIIDWLVGLFPVIGVIFDAAYRANLKNVDLLEKAAAKRR